MNQTILGVAPWILAGSALLGFLFCFTSFHAQLKLLSDRLGKRQQECLSGMEELKEQIGSLQAKISQSGPHTELSCGDSSAVRTSMNLNKRTQALRQYRQGQSPEVIAQSLDLTRAEVELLIKVQRIVSA